MNVEGRQPQSFPALSATPAYNPIFSRLVDEEEENGELLVGLVAYALYKRAKRNWAELLAEREGRKPSESELSHYILTWTDDRLDGLRQEAASALAAYADVAINAEEPKILRKAAKGSFTKGMFASMLASLLYTILLIFIAIVLKRAGVDLLAIAGSSGR